MTATVSPSRNTAGSLLLHLLKGHCIAASVARGLRKTRPPDDRPIMKDYHINIFHSEEDNGYIADIPDLESCSAFGSTPGRSTRGG